MAMEDDMGAPGADMMEAGGDTSTPLTESMGEEQQEGEGSGAIHIPGDMLPEDIRGKCKPGDMLTFTVVAPPDEEGDVAVEYTSHKYGSEGGTDSWENDFRKEMSPRSTSEGSPTPGGGQEGY